MENVFLDLFNMSINAGWLVLAILLFRLIFKKAPKSLRVVMWGLVGLRLICPFSFESVLSLIPSAEAVPPEMVYSNSSADVSGAEIFNAIGNNQVSFDLGIQDGNVVFNEYTAPDGDFINPLLIITYIASIVWVVGMAVMLLYTLISYLRILKNVREATPLKENIWLCDNISTPFILGIFKPRIFLPSSMSEQDMEFVVAHEKAHLKRRDHWWKPLGFALLTVYWFNPVLWVAYVLLCRDIELACDEKVIKEMGAEIKKPYSEALINCSVPRKMISACPLAFGETGVKGRIKSVLNYKKPAFWLIIVAVVICIITSVCFLTNPQKEINLTNSLLAVEKYYFDNVIGEDRANKEMNDIVYKIDSGNQFYSGDSTGIDWQKEGKLQAVSDDALWNMSKDYLPFYYKGLRLNKTYVAEDEYGSAYAVFITENNKIFIAILPHYDTEKMYVMNFLEVKQEELIIEKTEPLGVANVTSGTEVEGVFFDLMRANLLGDSRYIEILWTDETELGLTFGEECHIFKKVGSEWVECELPDNYAWNMLAYALAENSATNTIQHTYWLYGYEDFTSGKYRFETEFSLNKERPRKDYTAWLEFELLGVNAESDSYAPVELVYDNGMFSFVQTVDISPTYYVTKDMKLTEVFSNGVAYERGTLTEVSLNEENWDSRFSSEIWTDGYSYSQIKENNKKAWQLKVDNGEEDISILYLLLEQNDGTYFIAHGMYNNQSESPNNEDDSIIRWLYLVAKNATESTVGGADSPDETLQYTHKAGKDSAYISLTPETQEISFTFSMFSSYLPCGTYEEDGEYIVMKTDDGKNKYTFKKESGGLVFVADKSSPMPEYRYSQDATPEVCLPDGAVFTQYIDNAPYAVSFANYSGEFIGGLNADKMYISHTKHLPIFKFDNVEELNNFKSRYGETLTMDKGNDEIPSFNSVTEDYDNTFFEDKSLLLVYVPSGSMSWRYGVESISVNNTSLLVKVERTDNNETGNCAMSGWFITIAMDKEELENYTEFDAIMLEE